MASSSAAKSEADRQRELGDCALSSSWIFSVAGALIAIPVGIRRKSLAPLVFFGTTGAMLDIIQGITNCEKERAAANLMLEAGGGGGGSDLPGGASTANPESSTPTGQTV
eukprot:TRINITY_DN2559_c0_g1_i1.p1 TRINITY_DN2559_c0_g1~~TRINITY_DN2559_c0_g1_i1.p1  ORF type:complete len:110 (+),score=24.28 TRINITY_DN2559_c0_g1_i1:243-572(+)